MTLGITELTTKGNIISRNNKPKKFSEKPKAKKADGVIGPVRSMKNIRFRSQRDVGGNRDLVSERRVTLESEGGRCSIGEIEEIGGDGGDGDGVRRGKSVGGRDVCGFSAVGEGLIRRAAKLKGVFKRR